VEAEERFSDLLRDSLNDWQIFNLGVSGYGTDQEFLLLQDQFDFYKPEIVFLTFCADNDRLDNSMNLRYINYYKPYYEIEDGQLNIKGQPVPTSAVHWFTEHPFWSNFYLIRMSVNAWYKNRSPDQLVNDDPTHHILNAMDTYVRERGATLVIGLQKLDDPLIAFLTLHGIPFLDLSNDMVFSFSGNHWTADGHREVASRINAFIQDLEAD